MSNWTTAEILLATAVLVLAMPREDGFIIPERRDWLGWLRRLFPGARRQREEEAGREADRYVTDLRTDRDQPYMTLRQDQLPSTARRFRTPLLSPPSDKKQPWPTAENPAWSPQADPPPEKPRRRAPGDPPTIIIELMRPAIAGDLGDYLGSLPAYDELPSRPDFDSADSVFVPRSSLSLSTPDHEGAPGDYHEARPEAEDLHPDQPGAGDPPVEH